jgi:hypothetical protein
LLSHHGELSRSWFEYELEYEYEYEYDYEEGCRDVLGGSARDVLAAIDLGEEILVHWAVAPVHEHVEGIVDASSIEGLLAILHLLVFESGPRQKNLWVNSGSGSRPRAW